MHEVPEKVFDGDRELYVLELKIAVLPTNQLNSRTHWSKRMKESKFWDNQIHFRTAGRKPKEPLKKAKLTLVRHSCKPNDWDNLAATWKHPVDSLVSCKIIADDSWDVIGMPEFSWAPAKRNEGFITIRVEEL